jgi:AcrR family transcriptional regulator
LVWLVARVREKRPVKTPRRAATTAAKEPRARLEVDERRAQLVKLGMDLFSRRSYDDVSIDELARAAGISKGLLYHYFPTKRDFYVATVKEGAARLLEQTQRATGSIPDPKPVQLLHAGLDAYLDYVEAHGPAYAALLQGGIGADPEVARIVDRTRQTFCDRLLEGLPLATPGPLVRTALRGWVGFSEAASLEWIARRYVDRDALRTLLASVLLAAVELANQTGAKTE